MTHYILIATFFWATTNLYGQVTFSDKAILTEVLINSKTCNKLYFTDKTDSLFINQFTEQLKKKDTWLHELGRSKKIILSKADKTKILQELDANKKRVWVDNATFEDSKIVQLDSLFSVDNYVESSCLSELRQNNKSVKIFSFGKPIFIKDKHSFVIYIIEIGIRPNWKTIYYTSSKLMLYHFTKDKWTKAGDLYVSYTCNG